MKLSPRAKIFFLVLGDLAALYASLLIAIAVRYGGGFRDQFLEFHLLPFSVIFPLWLAVFYVSGLYTLRRLRNNIEFLKTLSLTLIVNALLTVAIFYLIPSFGITPKTTLFIFLAVFAVLESVWRRTFNIQASFREGLVGVLILGEGERTKEIVDALARNPQFGYDVRTWLPQGLQDPEVSRLQSLIKKHEVSLVVVPHGIKSDSRLAEPLYELLASGIEIRDLPSFYELVFTKVPLSELRESWFLEHRIGEKKFYDDLKRAVSFLAALVLTVLLSPVMLVIGLLIKATSPGPAICAQTRVGRHDRPYRHYKFRTMQSCTEKDGPRWTEAGDQRVIPVGKFLRYTHLDELPQLANILKGELAFVGPRPERPEFVALLKEKVPYYEIRHLVKPGVTGWAQINYRYGASIEDAYEKLQYDLYYLKNRSLVFDLAIILKTLKTFFVTPK